MVFGGNDRNLSCSLQTPPFPRRDHRPCGLALLPVSACDIEDLLAARGIEVSFQTVSEWAVKFGLKFADQLRRRSRGNFSDKWQLDEMVVTIKGKKYWLWRAVDANGYVLDALLQSRRNKAAALRLMRKLLKGQGTTPRVMVTDKISYQSTCLDPYFASAGDTEKLSLPNPTLWQIAGGRGRRPFGINGRLRGDNLILLAAL